MYPSLCMADIEIKQTNVLTFDVTYFILCIDFYLTSQLANATVVVSLLLTS